MLTIFVLYTVKTSFGSSLPEGYYIVGTGSTGVAECLLLFGGMDFLVFSFYLQIQLICVAQVHTLPSWLPLPCHFAWLR